ncbi:MAG: hypothetical protein ABIQ16_06565 [Polyangiaceae bacterium]
MTRKQVASRLGKSVATVRRIEGVLLYPTRDARGVHRFDVSEVDALARRVKNGSVQLSQAFSPVDGKTYEVDTREPCQRCTSLKQRVAGLLEELDEQRGRHDLEVREFQRERLAHEAESRELVAELAEYVDLLDRP